MYYAYKQFIKYTHIHTTLKLILGDKPGKGKRTSSGATCNALPCIYMVARPSSSPTRKSCENRGNAGMKVKVTQEQRERGKLIFLYW